MQKILMLLALSFLTFSCSDNDGDEHNHEEETTYTVAIMSPAAVEQAAGESVHIHVNFDEINEGTIHHINVKITNETTGEVIYDKPEIAHIHESSGHYEWHDDFILDVDNDSNLLLSAKVWGHEAGVAEVIEDISFDVK